MIDQLERTGVNLDQAQGKITDADIAKESTILAKEAINMQVSNSMSAKSNDLMDALIEMTTKHFRSHVLNSVLR